MAKNAKAKGKRGRPPMKAGEAKRASFNTRLRGALKSELEKSASDSGRSLSEEIEFRLEQSVQRQRALREMLELRFGSELARILDAGARDAAAEIRRITNGRVDVHASWIDTEATFNAARQAFENVFALVAPHAEKRPPRQSWLFAVNRHGINDIGGAGEWYRQGLTPQTLERIIARGRGSEPGESAQ
jgi:hypothetical protein